MQLTIKGVDKTNSILYQSLKIDNILTKQIDRCTFSLRFPVASLYTPTMGAEVIVLDDSAVRIFAGVITRLIRKSPNYGVVEYDVECADYTRLLDSKLVADTYTNMTVAQIITALWASYAPSGFTTTQVVCPTVVSYIQFQYLPLSECLSQLAKLSQCDWYVDYNKDLWFNTATSNAAPFSVTDTNGNAEDGTLVIRDDNSQIRTSIIVRGGEYTGTQFTSSALADGLDLSFRLPYKYTDFMIRVNGVVQNLGIDGIDDPASYDALYNFNEKIVKWKASTKPVQGATLSFSGKPNLPVIVRYTDPAAALAIYSAEGIGDGQYDYLISDTSIKSQTAARARAAAEINTYGDTLSEGEFNTMTSGLKAGMRILINSASRGLNSYYVINKVTTTMITPSTFRYQVSLITTKTFDYIAILKKLLYKENELINMNQNDLLDLVTSRADSFTMAETFTAQSKNWPVVFAVGTQHYSGFKRPFILDGSPLA